MILPAPDSDSDPDFTGLLHALRHLIAGSADLKLAANALEPAGRPDPEPPLTNQYA